jgi:isopentenyl-diphosphate Delta-isomerase
MSKPKILVVDQNDKPIGSADIQEADAKGLTRRIVRLMLMNSNGQLLLQKRYDDDLVYPGCWDNSVAGHVDAGEDSDKAMDRELAEELGIAVVNMHFFGKYYNEVKDRSLVIKKFNHIYKGEYNGRIDDIKNEEVEFVQWFELNDLKKLLHQTPEDFTDGVKEVIKRFY